MLLSPLAGVGAGLKLDLGGSLGIALVEDWVEMNVVPVQSGGEADMGSSLDPLMLTSE